MSDGSDFFWGFIKPTKDFVTSYVICAILTSLSFLQSPFDIWPFVTIWGAISIIDDAISGYCFDLKCVRMGYYEHIKALYRILGMIAGIILFWLLLAANFGASLGDVIGSVIFPIVFMFLGILLRMAMSTRIKW